MPALARWCFRHRKAVLALWVIAFIVIFAADFAAKPAYSSKFQLPNTDSARAISILQADFPAASGVATRSCCRHCTGRWRPPPPSRRCDHVGSGRQIARGRVGRQPVLGGGQGADQQVEDDRFCKRQLGGTGPEPPCKCRATPHRTATAIRSSSLEVELGGQAIENTEAQKPADSTGLGVVFALIILGVLFGAVLAAVIPIVTALIAIGIGFAFTGLMTHVFAVASFVPILGVLIGLGVGIDYALFIITRHRNGLRAGRSVEDSAVNAVNTAGRAVFFAGLTVCIAMLGQFALGVTFLYGLAIAAVRHGRPHNVRSADPAAGVPWVFWFRVSSGDGNGDVGPGRAGVGGRRVGFLVPLGARRAKAALRSCWGRLDRRRSSSRSRY